MTEYELERIPTNQLPVGTTIYVWYPDYSRQYSLKGLLFGVPHDWLPAVIQDVGPGETIEAKWKRIDRYGHSILITLEKFDRERKWSVRQAGPRKR